MPKVSIVTPVYNGSSFISSYFESILCQTFADFEVLVCDDNSLDDTVQKIANFAAIDKRIRLIENPRNLGVAISRNKCIEEARGRYIAFCDIDDTWSSEKLYKQISFMKAKNSQFSATNANIIDIKNVLIGSRSIKNSVCSFEDLLTRNFLTCSSVIYDSKKLGKQYFPEIRYAEDYSLWLTILKDRKVVCDVMQENLTNYRTSGTSESSNKINAAHGHFRALRFVGLRTHQLIYYMFTYALFSIFNVLQILIKLRGN